LGNGAGGFAGAITTNLDPSLTSPSSLAVGDLNGDGIPDAVVADSANAVMQVFKGNGDGTFTSQGVLLATPATSVMLADMNKDGRVDILLSQAIGGASATSGIVVFPSVAPATFTFGAGLLTAATGVQPSFQGFALADLNGDGKLDVVAAENKNQLAEVFL